MYVHHTKAVDPSIGHFLTDIRPEDRNLCLTVGTQAALKAAYGQPPIVSQLRRLLGPEPINRNA